MDIEEKIFEYLEYFDEDNILRTDYNNIRISICNYSSSGLALGIADFNKKKPAYYEALFFDEGDYRLEKHYGAKDSSEKVFFKNYSDLIIESIKEFKKLTDCRKIIKVLRNVDY